MTDPDAHRRAALTVTVTTRPDGGHYLDQADFTAHVTEWIRAGLKGKYAIDEVTIVDQAADPTDEDVVEAHRLALSFALDLGTGAPWDAIHERAQRLAAEEQPAEAQGQPAELPPVCEGFQWIGQSFATCDRCGHPAWDHAGEDVAVEGAGPFENRRTVRPWKPGEADAIRAKWGTPGMAKMPCSAGTFHVEHNPHSWEPQPGMDLVRCPGYPEA